MLPFGECGRDRCGFGAADARVTKAYVSARKGMEARRRSGGRRWRMRGEGGAGGRKRAVVGSSMELGGVRLSFGIAVRERRGPKRKRNRRMRRGRKK